MPLGSMTPVEADNVVAAGRCIDADLAALSSVRVMGPCIAMGHGAAHALDLAGKGSVHQLDTAMLRKRLHDNLERNDAQPKTEVGQRAQAPHAGSARMKLTDAEASHVRRPRRAGAPEGDGPS